MYDYIIVGAGSAGCVLAARLSEDPGTKVLLLEAGPSHWHPFVHVPAGLAKLVGDKGVNWDYDTEPQAQLDNRRLWWPRGKVLGGSSSINAMCYIRGHKRDYDEWVELEGRWQPFILKNPPPAPKQEEPPAAPSPEHQWRPGEWVWQPAGADDTTSAENFVWQPGKWEKPKAKSQMKSNKEAKKPKKEKPKVLATAGMTPAVSNAGKKK